MNAENDYHEWRRVTRGWSTDGDRMLWFAFHAGYRAGRKRRRSALRRALAFVARSFAAWLRAVGDELMR